MPKRLERLFTRLDQADRVGAEQVTELIKELKLDDTLTPAERSRLTQLVDSRRDHFEPEAARVVTSFLEGGQPLTGGMLPDPNLWWETTGTVELRTPRSAQLFIGGVQADDVVQNELGDCFLMSALASLAAVRPEAIERAVRDNGDGSYTVRFFERPGRGPPTELEVRVDADLPAKRDGTLLYGHGRDRRELWPAVIEKAYAQWKGGYGEIALGGIAGDALFALTGTGCDFYNPVSALGSQELWKHLVSVHGSGRAMVTGTNAEPDTEALGLVPMHMYSIVAVREENGEKLVRLRNPYGAVEPGDDSKTSDGTFELTLRQYRKHFEDLYFEKG